MGRCWRLVELLNAFLLVSSCQLVRARPCAHTRSIHLHKNCTITFVHNVRIPLGLSWSWSELVVLFVYLLWTSYQRCLFPNYVGCTGVFASWRVGCVLWLMTHEWHQFVCMFCVLYVMCSLFPLPSLSLSLSLSLSSTNKRFFSRHSFLLLIHTKIEVRLGAVAEVHNYRSGR